ncbi:unnamed protein product [Symbiodinium sp. CCMP2592]|nr:unnamed protein product [Symbiodinium sp. CCMP2592]
MDPAVDSGEEGSREDDPSPPWFLRVAMKFLLMFVKGGIEYCGILCVSIGLAAKWVYWLMAGMVLVALAQLAYWTYVWVLRPLTRFAYVLAQYLVGRAPWDEVLTHHGRTPFRLVWYGPTGQVAWTAQYIQDKVRGRGTCQAPFDLLVTDGTALARLRHGTIRGRTNRHGFTCPCDTVHGSSHRYWRHSLEGANCRVHLCSQSPCTAPEAAEVHVTSSSVVPREVELDLTELAGKGPFGRCLTATWLLSAQGYYLWKSLGGCICSCRRRCCQFCGCGSRPRRGPRPGGENGPEPSRLLHEWSETESEGDDHAQACQADQLAWEEGGKTHALCKEPCKDLALGDSIQILPADLRVSDKAGLQEEDGSCYARLCPRHSAQYGHASARRKCAVEGCVELSRTTKGREASIFSSPRLFSSLSGKVRPSHCMTWTRAMEPFNATRRQSKPHSSNAAPRSSTSKHCGDSTPPLMSTPSTKRSTLPDPAMRLKAIRVKTGAGRDSEERLDPPGDANLKAEALGKLVRNVALGQPAAKAYSAACQEYGLDPYTQPLQGEIAEQGQPQEHDPVLGAFHAYLHGTDGSGGTEFSAGAPPFVSGEQRHPALALYAARSEPGTPAPPIEAGQSAPPAERTPFAAASLFRPREEGPGAQGNPPPAGPLMQASTLPGGYQVLANAVRPFHAGAYTDAEPPRLDESAKALQAIARSLVKDDQGQEKGKLSAIGRQEERLVFLLRGCDSLDVPLAAGVVGKELFHSLRAAATQARPKLRQLRFPVNLTNRLCYALASASFGAKDVKSLPLHCGSAADFPQTEEADFDAYSSPPDLKLEARPQGPTTVSTWLRNALRQAWGLACVYGQQHYAVWEAAALHLTKLGEEHSEFSSACAVELEALRPEPAAGEDSSPAHVIFDVWEELWARFFEELREVDRDLRRLMREESPTFDRMKFVATAPNAEGRPWLRLPGTFRLEDPREYFTTDVLDRLQRQLSRAAWAQALRGPARTGLPGGGGRAGDASADGQAGHPGKVDDPPTRAGGEQAAKVQEGGGKRRPGRKANRARTEPGQSNQALPPEPPVELRDGGYTLQEEGLRKLVQGADYSWYQDQDHGQGKATAADLPAGYESPGLDLQERTRAMRAVEALLASQDPPLSAMPDLLTVFVRNYLLHHDSPASPQERLQACFQVAATLGGPELASQAAEYLDSTQRLFRAGSVTAAATAGRISWDGDIGYGTFEYNGAHWRQFDYQDRLPLSPEMQALLGRNETEEPKQCMLLHVAAGVLSTEGELPTLAAAQLLGQAAREAMYHSAREVEAQLGPPPEYLTRAEADFRVFNHDLLHFGHDRDYRTLVAYPQPAWEHLTFGVWRVEPHGSALVEYLVGSRSGPGGPVVWLLVHKGHAAAKPAEACLPARRVLACPVCRFAPSDLERLFGCESLAGHSAVAIGCPGPIVGAVAIGDPCWAFAAEPSARAALLQLLDSFEGDRVLLWVGPELVMPAGPFHAFLEFLGVLQAHIAARGQAGALAGPVTHRFWTHKTFVLLSCERAWARARVDSCALPPGGGGCLSWLIRGWPASAWTGVSRLCRGGHTHFGDCRAASALWDFLLAFPLELRASSARDGGGGEQCALPLRPPTVLDSAETAEAGTQQGSPLAEPPSADLGAAIGAYLDLVAGAPYDPKRFAEAARLGTKARAAAPSFPEALRALRREWTLRQGDHFKGLFEAALDELLPSDLLHWLRHTATQGVDARYEGDRQRVRATPHPSLQGHLTEAFEQIWKDVSKGRVLLLTCPGDATLLEGVISVPLARVPKMLPNRTVSAKGRLIWDARRVNEHCSKHRYFPALQPRHSEIARLILWWQTRFPHIPIYLAKKDVSDAFKWLWIQSEDGPLFGADLPGTELGLPEGVTAVYTAMTFGWTGAPGSFMGFAWGVKLLHSSHTPTQPLWHDTTAFKSLMLMDDAVVIEPALGLRPRSYQDLEEGTLTFDKVIWGLSYDTRDNTVSLPGPKLEKAGHLLLLPDFDRGNTHLALRLVQELRGNLEFWAAVLPTVNPYLHSINALLKPPDEQGRANPQGDPSEVAAQWDSFWDTLDLLRLLAQDRASWSTRFSNPLFAALDTNEILALPGVSSKVIWVTADATPTHVGAVDWSSKIAVAQTVGQFLAAVALAGARAKLEASFSPGTGEDEECEDDRLQIALAELVALLLLCAHRREAWKGCIILYAGDNQNVITWVRSRRSGHAGASFLLLVLGALEVTHGFQIRGEYVRTYRNTTADRLTREEPAGVCKAMGLTLLKKDPDWDVLLEQGWSRRALVWAGQPHSDRGTAVQLALRGTHSPQEGRLQLPTVTLYLVGEHAWTQERVWTGQGARVEWLRDGDTPEPAQAGTCVILGGALNARKEVDLLRAAESALRPHAAFIDLLHDALGKKTTCGANHELTYRQGVAYGRALGDRAWWKRGLVLGLREDSAPGAPEKLSIAFNALSAAPETIPAFDPVWANREPTTWIEGGTLKAVRLQGGKDPEVPLDPNAASTLATSYLRATPLALAAWSVTWPTGALTGVGERRQPEKRQRCLFRGGAGSRRLTRSREGRRVQPAVGEPLQAENSRLSMSNRRAGGRPRESSRERTPREERSGRNREPAGHPESPMLLN